jgi:hypothetical protein
LCRWQAFGRAGGQRKGNQRTAQQGRPFCSHRGPPRSRIRPAERRTLDRYSSVLVAASSYRSCMKDPKSCTQRDGLHPLSGCLAFCPFLNWADSLKFPPGWSLASSASEPMQQASGARKRSPPEP